MRLFALGLVGLVEDILEFRVGLEEDFVEMLGEAPSCLRDERQGRLDNIQVFLAGREVVDGSAWHDGRNGRFQKRCTWFDFAFFEIMSFDKISIVF